MSASYSSQRSTFDDSVRGAAQNMADKASDLANKAGYQVDKAIDGAESAARSVAQSSREAGERVTEVAGNFKSALDRSIKDQPTTTLAVAVALGFVVGALWKS